ncbi:MAG: hypothetical protein HQ402_02850 [Parcubacteria group bacterium]|nr:hypothetical protein [Parcubacteria group bacterium]
MNPSIFKAYDIRGIYPDDVNEEVVEKIAEACAMMFNSGIVIVAHDVRHGSISLAQKAKKGLEKKAQELGKNIKVEFVGQSSTPMFYFLVNRLEASGGIMITASHNPKNYNGMKISKEKAVLISGLEIKEFMEKNHINI